MPSKKRESFQCPWKECLVLFKKTFGTSQVWSIISFQRKTSGENSLPLTQRMFRVKPSKTERTSAFTVKSLYFTSLPKVHIHITSNTFGPELKPKEINLYHLEHCIIMVLWFPQTLSHHIFFDKLQSFKPTHKCCSSWFCHSVSTRPDRIYYNM